MMAAPLRYPTTPYLPGLWAGRDDPVDPNGILARTTVVHEKLDGLNVGVRADPTGRHVELAVKGHDVTPADRDNLRPLLDTVTSAVLHRPGLQIFGELMAGTEDQPQRWFVFDVYDEQAERFWPVERTIELAGDLGVPTPRVLHRGPFTDLEEARTLLCRIHAAVWIEGFLLRLESGGWLAERYKLVRPDFRQHAWPLG